MEADDAEEFAEELRLAGLHDRLLSPEDNVLLTPVILAADDMADLSSRLHRLTVVMQRVLQNLANDNTPALLRRLGYPPEAAALLGPLSLPANLPFGRWDLLQDAKGWKVLELNVGGATGGQDDRLMQAIYDRRTTDHPRIPGSTGNSAPFSALAQLLPESAEGRLVVVDDDDELAASPLSAQFAARSLCALTGRMPDILPVSALPMDKVAPFGVFELFTLRDCLARPERYSAYLTATATGTIGSMNPIWNDLFMNKGLMALVHEEVAAGRKLESEASLVHALIPWTALVEASNLDLILSRPKEALVLKAANGYGGKDVHCGWTLSQSIWEKSLIKAVQEADTFVVQERVIGQKIPVVGMTPRGDFIETDAAPVIGIFCDSALYAGAFARASLTGHAIVNAHNKAAVGVVRLS
ncbi:MAG TPA: hypothetical protein PK450_01045 [Paracoccaceae bacterium]|nr:hypothetical protein [Paracoccaceae bacterium]